MDTYHITKEKAICNYLHRNIT